MQQMEEQPETNPTILVDGNNAHVASRDLFERVNRIERVRTRRLDIRRVRKIVINNPPVTPLRVAPRAFDKDDTNAITCPNPKCRLKTLTLYYTTCLYCGETFTQDELLEHERTRLELALRAIVIVSTGFAALMAIKSAVTGTLDYLDAAAFLVVAPAWLAYYFRHRFYNRG